MSDDLNLLIKFIDVNDKYIKIALKLKHGLSDEFWRDNYIFFNEDDVFEKYSKLFLNFKMKQILEIEEVFEINIKELK